MLSVEVPTISVIRYVGSSCCATRASSLLKVIAQVYACRVRALLVSSSLLLFAVAACGDTSPGRHLIVAVDVAHPGATLPEDFLGLSFEASVLGSARLSPSASNLPALLKNLGVGHLRFGGNS